MFLEFYGVMVQFLRENVVLIGLLMSIVQYVKLQAQNYDWYQGWMATVFAFVLGFALAIPETGFANLDVLVYVAHAVGLGLVGTGLYKVGDDIASTMKRD